MVVEPARDAGALQAALDLFERPPEAEHTSRLLATPTSHVLVAYSETQDDVGPAGDPLGVIVASEVTGSDLSIGLYVTWVAVRPAYRRLGVGSALVREMLRLAENLGCTFVRGTIQPENHGGLYVTRALGAAAEDVSINVSWELTTSRLR